MAWPPRIQLPCFRCLESSCGQAPSARGLSQHRSSRKASKRAGAITAATRGHRSCGVGGGHHGRRRARPHGGARLCGIPAPDLDLGQKLGDSWSQYTARRVRKGETSQHSLLLIMSYDVGSLISAFISVPGFREKNNYFLFFSWKVRSSC